MSRLETTFDELSTEEKLIHLFKMQNEANDRRNRDIGALKVFLESFNTRLMKLEKLSDEFKEEVSGLRSDCTKLSNALSVDAKNHQL